MREEQKPADIYFSKGDKLLYGGASRQFVLATLEVLDSWYL